jgi:AcrR family transcriptional regulator
MTADTREGNTRERLVVAAWECVRKHGTAGATSRAVTTAAGANLGAITYYFGSKDALVAEAVGGAIEALLAPALHALQDETRDPVGRLLGAVTQLQLAYEQSDEDAPAYLEVLIQSRRHPELQQRVSRILTEIRAILSKQMAELKTRGFLPDWVQPEPMAGLLLAVAQGVVLQTAIDAAGPNHTSMADQFAQLLLASRADTH